MKRIIAIVLARLIQLRHFPNFPQVDFGNNGAIYILRQNGEKVVAKITYPRRKTHNVFYGAFDKATKKWRIVKLPVTLNTNETLVKSSPYTGFARVVDGDTVYCVDETGESFSYNVSLPF